jgi:acid stress chaperone HdeB
MKRNIVASFCVLLFTSVVPASAQLVIDLSLITCKQLLDSDAERQALISSWMSGYFGATKNLNELDFRYVKRIAKVVGNCKTHKSDTVMNAMRTGPTMPV